MAVRIFARLSNPLMQCLRYSVNANAVAVQPSKLTSSLRTNVGRWQISRSNSTTSGDRPGENESGAGKNITLVFPDGASQLMSLEKAERIAKTRNSELIDMRDDADCRVVYRMVPLGSSKDANGRNKAEIQEKPKKEPKSIDINTTTTERDLLVKCKKIVKMVQNNHSVRIRLHNAEQMNRTTKTPEQEIRDILESTVQDLGTIKEESRNEKKTILIVEPQPKEEQKT